MYLLFGVFILILIFFACINYYRKKCIIKKVCCMSDCDKCLLLNELVEPFGYCYDNIQDIFSSSKDAWQRAFGYSYLYDKTASRFHMVFDCLPVYFDYGGKTWLLEFWKGQYGINTGGEIGLYHADRLISPQERKHTLFASASDNEMLNFSFRLTKDTDLAAVSARHWWLTCFLMGTFSRPEDLSMEISITFPDCDMRDAFVNGLMESGYHPCDICLCSLTVRLVFQTPVYTQCGCLCRIHKKFAQCMNRIFCRLFLWITKPFCTSADRLLYLWFYVPFAFRRTFRLHGRKHRHRKKKERHSRPNTSSRQHPENHPGCRPKH